ADGLIGLEAVAVTALDPFGSIEVEGELWDARIEAGNVEKGGRVEIEMKEGHILKVKPIKDAENSKEN
ncbi:MAG: NfeD family protein, partial [Nitrospinota bacterium]